MKFPERHHTFVEPRFRHPHTYIANILNTSLSAWSRYFAFLEIIHNRYTKVSALYTEAMHRQLEANRAEAGSRQLTAEQWEEMQRTSALGLQVHLEIVQRRRKHLVAARSPNWSCEPTPAVAYQQPKQQAQENNIRAKAPSAAITRAPKGATTGNTGMSDYLPA